MFALKSSVASRAAVSRPQARSVRVQAAADRPLWFPGNPAPAHLDGTLAGDYGFDPLFLSQEPEMRKWMVQAELVHCRWAMLGAAGVLFTAAGAEAGLPFPQWYEAGKLSLTEGTTAALPAVNMSFGTNLMIMLFAMNFVEVKRWYDLKNPGSQADGSFLGFTEELKGKENGYPGGKWFDPFGMAAGSDAQYKKYKENEVRNGRLAMLANLGFWAQYAATGKGPIQCLNAHLADPTHVTFATNGVSIPFLG